MRAVDATPGSIIDDMIRINSGSTSQCSMIVTMAVAVGLAACTPALNWRDVRIDQGSLTALFPCKPDKFVRDVPIAGIRGKMRLSSCQAADATYAVSSIDLAQVSRVPQGLQELRAHAAANLGGPAIDKGLQPVPGAEPSGVGGRISIAGARADGSGVRAEAIFFSLGSVVYQATVVGTQIDPEATDAFLSALKVGR